MLEEQKKAYSKQDMTAIFQGFMADSMKMAVFWVVAP
jgi:hypothetical protein